jgi:hypothetical protein
MIAPNRVRYAYAMMTCSEMTKFRPLNDDISLISFIKQQADHMLLICEGDHLMAIKSFDDIYPRFAAEAMQHELRKRLLDFEIDELNRSMLQAEPGTKRRGL